MRQHPHKSHWLGAMLLRYWLLSWGCLSPFFANAMDFSWLATGNLELQRINLDDACPKRYLQGIRVSKQANDDPVIHVDEVHWALTCTSETAPKASAPVEPTTPQTPQQRVAAVADLLNQLGLVERVAQLPNITLNIKGIRLYQNEKPWLDPWQLQANITSKRVDIRLYQQANQLTLGLDRIASQWQIQAKITTILLEQLNLPLPAPILLQPQISISGNLHQPTLFALQVSSPIQVMPWLEKGQVKGKAQLDLAKQRVLLTEFNLLSMLRWQQLRVNKGQLSLAEPAVFDLTQATLNAEFLVQKAKWGKHALPDIRLASKTRYQIAPSRLDATLSLSSLMQLIETKLTLAGNQLRVELIPGELNLVEANKTATGLRWLDKTQIDSGKIGYTGSLNYHLTRGDGRLDVAIDAKSISGLVQDFVVENAALSLVQGYEIAHNQLSSKQDDNHLSIDLLDIGVPLSAIDLDFKADIHQPEIRDLSAYVLGGELRIKRFKPLALGRTDVSIKGVQLAGLLAYGQLPGASATGVLDANIPLLKEADGFHIYQGEIAARAPGGHIAIPDSDVVSSIASTNVGVEFIFKILEDLRYSDLVGKLNYQPNGDMQIEAKIKGNSPHVSKTRPIEFNYSHQENLIQLLRSLRFSNELERKIEEKYL
ncbi:YdbH domain-containing protein [Motilimonas eburnea]|uniref:YdbH domain-containing protein n=1 Tax=Motilimonas eburnea TaxID=1737488 RepID=UPI001E345965|nr:YdbH domain-containing protein [Motilimonas eburnea]MCE2572144.1 YdbH domain-containing protein [Motilimonas eburnea]